MRSILYQYIDTKLMLTAEGHWCTIPKVPITKRLSLYCKQHEPWSKSSLRISVIRDHTVCFDYQIYQSAFKHVYIQYISVISTVANDTFSTKILLA